MNSSRFLLSYSSFIIEFHHLSYYSADLQVFPKTKEVTCSQPAIFWCQIIRGNNKLVIIPVVIDYTLIPVCVCICLFVCIRALLRVCALPHISVCFCVPIVVFTIVNASFGSSCEQFATRFS